MANTVTLSDMRTKIRRRADMENSGFISDAELNDWINDSQSELYDLIIQKHEDYNITSTSLSTVSGQESYNLPSDFYKLRGIDVLSGNNTYSLKQFMFNERNLYQNGIYYGYTGTAYFLYRLVGNTIKLIPTPTTAESLTVWYIPTYTKLQKDTDVFTFITVPGWEEYIEIDCAIKCMEKEESDASQLMNRKAMIIKRIESAAGSRDANEPQRITDISRSDFEDVWGSNA